MAKNIITNYRELTLDKNKTYYLASPYTHESETIMNSRFKTVSLVAGELFKQGYLIFSPITMSQPIEEYADTPTTFAFWRNFDLTFLKKCDELLVLKLDGWKESYGVTNEIACAHEVGKIVRYIRCDKLHYEYVLKEFKREINAVMAWGAEKHGALNWQNEDGSKSSHKDMHDSMFHHLSDSFSGPGIDKDSGLLSTSHLSTRSLMAGWRRRRGMK